ncbi:MAG: NADH-quinone oxidoreductase subunit H [Candidatus Bathyarchaeota archaeon]|nr:NADH-quinone oxidoreductase subunit H [Candidatus Bathyarchaeum sp.]
MAIDLIFFVRTLVFPGFLFLLVLVLFFDWFERKVAARFQNRMGPSYAGPFGILQPIADYIKLFSKEDITPKQTNKFLFVVAPILAFSLFVFALFYIPIDGSNVILDSSFEGDLLLVLLLVTLANFGIFLSGWASLNPYSGIGATRILTQFLGYDIPLILLAIGPAFLAKSLSIVSIASSQVTVPFILLIPWSCVLFILVLQAELEKDPFDIPHAETEIVGGYETEYSGRKLAFIKLSEDFQFLIGASLVTVLFLGGFHGPVFIGPAEFWYVFWFIVKTLGVVFILEYVGNVSARLRIDQVVHGNWKLLIPLSILSLALTILVEPLLRSVIG